MRSTNHLTVRRRAVAASAALAGVAALTLTGCPRAKTPATPAESTTASAEHAAEGHTHRAMHGGQILAVGDYHFELAYEPEGRFALYVMGSDEALPLAVAAEPIELQLRDEAADASQLKSLALQPAPLESEPAGKASRFMGGGDDLAGLADFTAVARVPIGEDSWRASFQFVGGRPIAETLAEGYACPMHCEQGKVYQEPGECPVCHMKLEEARDGQVAHADHAAKHGGVFFMAADNWHHLEGTLPSDRELRIYLYDNFTEPLPAAGYSGQLVVQPVDEDGDERGNPATVPLVPVEGETWLVAELPEGFQPPYQTDARLTFPNQDQEFQFNFDFQGHQGE